MPSANKTPSILWITIKDKNNIDDCILNNINNIKNMNRHYDLQLIDNNDFENILIKEKKLEWFNYYLKLNKKFGAMIADYVRYCLLYLYGGVYIDCKSFCKYPFDRLINSESKPIFFEWKTQKVNEYLNYFLISPPEHPVYLDIINSINKNIDNYNPLEYNIRYSKSNVLGFTGPHFIKNIIDEHIDEVHIKNNEYRKKTLMYLKIKNHDRKFGVTHYSKVHEHLVTY